MHLFVSYQAKPDTRLYTSNVEFSDSDPLRARDNQNRSEVRPVSRVPQLHGQLRAPPRAS